MRHRRRRIGLWFAFLILWAGFALAEMNYVHHAVSDWLLQPKVWTNARLEVLWSAGPGYDTLVLENGTQRILTTQCKAGSAAFNDRGQAAWVETDGRVFLYDGRRTRSLSPPEVYAWNVALNNRGQVAWDASDATAGRQIYFFDGRRTERLTAAGVNGHPVLSQRGTLAWVCAADIGGALSDLEICYFNGRRVLQLTDNDLQDDYLRMADNGTLVWLRYDPDGADDSEVFLYDRRQVRQLTDNDQDDFNISVSPQGLPLWVGWDGEDFELFSLLGGAVWQVTDNDYEDSYKWYQGAYRNYQPISRTGRFAWIGWAGSEWPWEVFYYDGVNILRLTDNATFDMNPLVNDSGMVVWTHHAGPYNQSGELHLYAEGNSQALTTDKPVHLSDVPLAINSSGGVVYVERNRDTGEERIWRAMSQ